MNNEVSISEKRIDESEFLEMRKVNLLRWPTGADVDFERALERQKSLPDHKRLDLVMRKAVAQGRCLVQPRG